MVCVLITKQDVLEAIAECQGTRSPNANTAIKLAAFFTILDHLDEKETARPEGQSFAGYSFANDDGLVQFDGGSEFAQAVDGRKQSEIWPIMDELMSTIKVMNERLYNGIMRKLH